MKFLASMFKKIGVGATMGIGIAILIALLYALSWIATCGLIYLITLCFGWTFKWSIATGIWLLMIILRSIFNHTVTVKK